MKKEPRPEAVIRHARIFGAGNIQVVQRVASGAKEDTTKSPVENFRTLRSNGGARGAAEAHERASANSSD